MRSSSKTKSPEGATDNTGCHTEICRPSGALMLLSHFKTQGLRPGLRAAAPDGAEKDFVPAEANNRAKVARSLKPSGPARRRRLFGRRSWPAMDSNGIRRNHGNRSSNPREIHFCQQCLDESDVAATAFPG